MKKFLVFSFLVMFVFVSKGYGQIVGWQFGSPASLGSETTYNATTNDANLNTSVLSRGSGITATGLGRGFSANAWDIGATKLTAVSNGEYFQFIINAKSGFKVSLSTLDARLRRSGATAPNAYIWKYSIDGTNFIEIGTDISFTSTVDGVDQSQITLSSISDLQNVTSSTTITFRIYAWGGTSGTATFSIARYATSITTNCLSIGGTVTTGGPTPTITTVNSMTAFTTTFGTPSAPQNYSVSGINLTTDIIIAPPTDFDVSLSSGSGYVVYPATLTLTQKGGAVGLTTIYVRYNPLSPGTHSRIVGQTSTGAAASNISVSGSTPVPAITTTSSMTMFTTTFGTPSEEQTYTVSGTDLTNDIAINIPTDFEISLSHGSGFIAYPATLTLAQTGGTVGLTTIYVRYNPLTSGTHPRNLIHTSTWATDSYVSISGTTTLAIHSLPLAEDFNYLTGSNLTDNGWSAHSVGGSNSIMVVSPSLTYTGYITSNSGNAVSLQNLGGEDDNILFTPKTSGTVYFSFLVSVVNSKTGGDYFIHFATSNVADGTFLGRIFIKKSSTTNFDFGLNKSNVAGSLVYTSGAPYTINTTYLVVLKYTFNTGSTSDDEVSLFINPPVNNPEPTPTLTVNDGSTDGSNIGALCLRQGNPSASASVIIDGIRVTTTWADIPLPIKLNSFSANVNQNNVNLNWKTTTETNNSGFEIYRDNIKVGFVKGKGTTNEVQSYAYTDKDLQSGKYNYKLKQIDYNGNFEYYNLANAVEIKTPNKFTVNQNYPNPFNPVTKISYTLPLDTKVEIKIFDVIGKEIFSLTEIKNAGYNEFNFDGTKLSSGIYFYKITAGDVSKIRKMILIK